MSSSRNFVNTRQLTFYKSSHYLLIPFNLLHIGKHFYQLSYYINKQQWQVKYIRHSPVTYKTRSLAVLHGGYQPPMEIFPSFFSELLFVRHKN